MLFAVGSAWVWGQITVIAVPSLAAGSDVIRENEHAARAKWRLGMYAALTMSQATVSTPTSVARVEDGRLRYIVTGRGDTAMVFIHGFALDHRMWESIAPAFAGEHVVLTYDLRGFGALTLPRLSYSHAKDLERLLDIVGIDAAHIVGFSLGGAVALDFALSHKQRVLTLVLADSIPPAFPRTRPPVTTSARLKQAAFKRGTAAARRCFLRSTLFTYAKRSGAVATLLPMIEEYSGWHWLNDDPGHWLTETSAVILGALDKPTLVITSKGDQPDVRRAGRWLTGTIRSSRHVVVPSGHFTPVEATDIFTRSVRSLVHAHTQAIDDRPKAHDR